MYLFYKVVAGLIKSKFNELNRTLYPEGINTKHLTPMLLVLRMPQISKLLSNIDKVLNAPERHLACQKNEDEWEQEREERHLFPHSYHKVNKNICISKVFDL